MNYRSIADLNRIILLNLHNVPRDIDAVIGIPRSGMLPATLLSLYLNKPLSDIDTFINNGLLYSSGKRQRYIRNENNQKILVVDDSIYSGDAMEQAKDKLSQGGHYDALFGAIYATNNSKSKVDIFFEIVEDPRVFQWNIFHHGIINKTCVDIDGVLCCNPSPDQDDDGERYVGFILNARPLYIPTTKIHTIVSCRLNKFKEATEEWLRKHGVIYDNLVLLDMPDRDSRRHWSRYAEFKAYVYSRSSCDLFIESDRSQAIQIAYLSQKPVLCTSDFRMYNLQKVSFPSQVGQRNIIPNNKEVQFIGRFNRIFPQRIKWYYKKIRELCSLIRKNN